VLFASPGRQLTLTTGDWSIAAYSTKLTDRHDIVAIDGRHRN